MLLRRVASTSPAVTALVRRSRLLSSAKAAAAADDLSALLEHAELDVRDDGDVGKVLSLRHSSVDEPLATLLLMDHAGSRLMYGARTHADLPLSACAPLVSYVKGLSAEPDSETGAYKQLEAAAALHGLCGYAERRLGKYGTKEVLLKQFGTAATDAAIAMCSPGAAHETVVAAKEPWQALARGYARSEAAEECELYRNAGATDVGVVHMGDTRPESLATSGGAVMLLAWAAEMSPLVKKGVGGAGGYGKIGAHLDEANEARKAAHKAAGGGCGGVKPFVLPPKDPPK